MGAFPLHHLWTQFLDKILWTEGDNVRKKLRKMLAEYGSFNGISKRKVFLWAETFQSGRPSLSDEAVGSPGIMKFICFRYTKIFS